MWEYGFCRHGGWDVVIVAFMAVMLIGIDNIGIAIWILPLPLLLLLPLPLPLG